MEFDTLNFFMDHMASTGTCFSVEHRVALRASLIKLCYDNKFENVHYWGTILGTESDYCICYGIGKDWLKDRTYFYSSNHGLQWILLPPATPQMLEFASASKDRFIGDPTADTETDILPEDADVMDEGDPWVSMKEEERLSGTVTLITNEAAIVPRGALLRSPQGLTYPNKTFEGLRREDATQLVSYLHVREPEHLYDKNVVRRPDYNLCQDFLESIASDIPVGCWTIKFDKEDNFAMVQSLYWPGACGVAYLQNGRRYNMCGWNLQGWWYVGTGKKNWDVPFMIAPPPNLIKASVVPPEDMDAEEMGEGDSAEVDARKVSSTFKPYASTANSPRDTDE